MQQENIETVIVEQAEHDQIAQRRLKLEELRRKGNAYPNHFRRDALAADLQAQYADSEHDALEAAPIHVKIAGRMMLRRLMGKASFAHLQDMSGRIQIYVRKDDLPEGVYEAFKHWDIGDFLGVSGNLFKTKTGELSIKVDHIELLTKALRPLPDKFHGLADQELRYRQRYLDLMVNPETKRIFEIRSKLIEGIRRFLNQRGFLEVETPMMQALAGGGISKALYNAS